MILMLQMKFHLAPLCRKAAETQRRLSAKLKLQIKLEVSARLAVIRDALKGNLYICVCGCDKVAELEWSQSTQCLLGLHYLLFVGR